MCVRVRSRISCSKTEQARLAQVQSWKEMRRGFLSFIYVESYCTINYITLGIRIDWIALEIVEYSLTIWYLKVCKTTRKTNLLVLRGESNIVQELFSSTERLVQTADVSASSINMNIYSTYLPACRVLACRSMYFY